MQWLQVFYVALATTMTLLMNGVMSEHVPSLQMSDVLSTNRTMDNCVYCEVFTTLIRVALQKDQEEIDQIRLYADTLCEMLGNQSLCHQYMDKLDAVVDGLKKGESSHTICKELKFCITTPIEETTPVLNMTIWNQSSVTIDSCFFCTQVASLLKVALAQNPEQINEIRQIADLICNILPKTNKCHKVMENVDQLIDLLRKGEEPVAVCRDMHICPKNESLIHLILIRDGESAANNTCMYCSGVLIVLEIALKQKPDQIQVAREMAGIVCDMLPATDQCHDDLKMFDTALSGLKAGKGPHAICTDLHFCTKVEGTESVLVTTPPELAIIEDVDRMDEPCVYCQMFTTLIEVAMQQDKTEMDEIRQYADMICGMLGDQNLCHQYVDKLDFVVDALKKGESVHKICEEMKFCATIETTEEVPLPSMENNDCAYCTGVLTVLEIALKQKPDEIQAARDAAGIVCDLLPADDKCHADLKMFDMAVSELKSGKGPHEVCKDLNVCTASMNMIRVPIQSLDLSLKPSVCIQCKRNMLLWASIATRPESLKTFEYAVESICALIPKFNQCKLLMKHHDVIVDALHQDQDMDTICTRIHSCTPAPDSLKASDETADVSMGCLLCEYTAEVLIHTNKNMEELRLAKKALETMCFILPPSARCDVLSAKFDQLVDLVEAGKNANEACGIVTLCSVKQGTEDQREKEQKPVMSTGNLLEVE